MTGHSYTDEQLAFLRDNVKDMPYRHLTELFNHRFGLNLSERAIKDTCLRRKFLRGITHRYTDEQLTFLRDNVKDMPYRHLTELFNHRFGLNIPEQTIIQTCLRHKCPRGRWATRPVGYERVNVNGYIAIKIAEPNKWRLKHQLIWESLNGPIPKGHVVLFVDRNSLNLSPENLLLVSRSELARLNRHGLIFSDAESTKAGLQIAKIKNAIGSRQKEIKNG